MIPNNIIISYEVNTYKDIEFADEILYSASFNTYKKALTYYKKEVKEQAKRHFIELIQQIEYYYNDNGAYGLTTQRETITHSLEQ